MRSYTELITSYKTYTSNSDTENTTFGTTEMNNAIRFILGLPVSWKFLETSALIPTVAAQRTYTLPYDFGKAIALEKQNGTIWYIMNHVKWRDQWNRLTSIPIQSDFLSHYYIDDRSFETYPLAATSAQNMNLTYKKRAVDIGTADYVTGTVTMVNGDATVVGSGTTFTAAMVGRYFKVNNDGNWYKILTFTDATHLELDNPYQGTSGASLSYTIGQMSVLPDNHDHIPAFYAAYMYYSYRNVDKEKASMFKGLWEEGLAALKADNISSSMNVGMVDDREIRNPNLYPQSMTQTFS